MEAIRKLITLLLSKHHYVAVVDAILNIDLRHSNMTANETVHNVIISFLISSHLYDFSYKYDCYVIWKTQLIFHFSFQTFISFKNTGNVAMEFLKLIWLFVHFDILKWSHFIYEKSISFKSPGNGAMAKWDFKTQLIWGLVTCYSKVLVMVL